jgi:hypothetical protein
MAIKRYFAEKDTTITNAFKANLITRGVSGNMGLSDILEVFSIYGQANTSSSELSRVLVQFPTSNILSDRNAGLVPASGSVSWYLKLYNAKHGTTTPRNFQLVVNQVSSSWDEGYGLDMEEYSDVGTANWVTATSSSSGTSSWVSQGGDYYNTPISQQSFDTGIENLIVDVSPMVEQWLSGTKSNYGFGVRLSSSLEQAAQSYYTKKFFARGSEFFFYRPVLEARWNSIRRDQRGVFYASSSLASAADNLNTIYLYNVVRGQLKNIPSIGTGSIYVKIYNDPSGSMATGTLVPTPNNPVTGGWYATGIYTASFALNTTASQVFDRWFDSTLTNCFHTGSIDIIDLEAEVYNPTNNYVTSLTNLKPSYDATEQARFQFFIRRKDWNPTIYNVATNEIPTELIESASYKIVRVSDNLEVIPYGTGSDLHTGLSYDVFGSYFDLDMRMLEPDYMYQIKLSFYDTSITQWKEQPQTFKFRVEKNES